MICIYSYSEKSTKKKRLAVHITEERFIYRRLQNQLLQINKKKQQNRKMSIISK